MANVAGQTGMPRLVATGISAGTDMTCATVQDGSVWCWGENDDGQLGDGTTTGSDVPVRVQGITTAVEVTAGGTWDSGGNGAAHNPFACAVLTDGTVRCWGELGFLFQGSGLNSSSVPVTIAGVTDATAVVGGDMHACALTRGSRVQCWGDNCYGELGNVTTLSCRGPDCPWGPVQVSGLSGVTAITAKGSGFTCAVVGDGSVECWGDGVGTSPSSTAPQLVLFPELAVRPGALDVGYDITCAIAQDDRSVRCWNGVPALGREPLLVSGLRSSVVQVGTRWAYGCALLSDGSVACWDWEASPGATPVTVSGVADAVAISVGYGHACALTQAGGVSCWTSTDATRVLGFD
jgi:hypothetical protein